MCVDISGLLEVFPSSDIIVVCREECRFFVLRREAGAFTFNQVADKAVVAAVPLQSGPAGAVKELWLRCLLEVEKTVTGFVEGLRRSRCVLLKDASDNVGELG
jgi:hypothetical protein